MSKEKVIIDLCSSSDEEEEDEFSDCEIIEEQDLDEETEEDDDSSFSENEDDSDWSHDDDDDATESDVEIDEDDVTREKRNDEDDDDVDDKISRLLTAGSDLKALNLVECKSYLRKHGLRLSGTKAVCIERIIEHWRIKDGSGEAAYPRSSFTINCKGDVCKGDTVLFTQKVPQKSGKIIGRRTVAGQVVKESYGTAKQQHTFTIEVLWCEGIQKLPPLYPLLVKGRNLYRLMTLRRRWDNEDERVKVLSEKHSRGAAARKVMRERKIKLGYVFKDGRLQKPDHVMKKTKKQHCQVKTRKTENNEPNPSHSHKNPTQCRNMNQPSHSYAPHPPRPSPLVPLPLNVPPRPNVSYSTQQNRSNHQRPVPQQALYHGSSHPPSNHHQRRHPPPQQQQAYYNNIRPTSNAPQGHQRRPYHNHNQNHNHYIHTHNNHHAISSKNSGYGVRDLEQFSDMMISQRRREGDTLIRPYKNHYAASDLAMINQRRERDTYTHNRPNHR